MVVRIILIVLFLCNSLLFSKNFRLKYPLDNKFKVEFIEVKEFGLKSGRQSYKVDYNNFFLNCKIEKSYLFPYQREVYCDKTINIEKLKYYNLLYGQKLPRKLKRVNNFYVNYYNNVTRYDNKLLTGFKNKFEVFMNSKKEVLFYSKMSFNTGKIYKLSYSSLLPLYFNIIIYLYKNSIQFNLYDIKVNSSDMILSDSISQEYYDLLNYEESYLISIDYKINKNNFNIKRSFNLVIAAETRVILFLFIKDIGVKTRIVGDK